MNELNEDKYSKGKSFMQIEQKKKKTWPSFFF